MTGPLHQPVEAHWRLEGNLAVLEMASASGLAVAGGASRNDPVGATSRGTGQLICRAIDAGATKVIVCVGGAASTDGGLGAVDVVARHPGRGQIELIVASDVRTPFLEAAERFAPQKGASPEQVTVLNRRLQHIAAFYEERFGVDVTQMGGAGAAGGLAGGLAALGAGVVEGFTLVSDQLGLREQIRSVDLVVTGEGRLDPSSFDGKVVGGVASLAAAEGVACVAIAGVADPGASGGRIPFVSLTERYGEEAATAEVLRCIEAAAVELLDQRSIASQPTLPMEKRDRRPTPR